jgi:hypothetical protein
VNDLATSCAQKQRLLAARWEEDFEPRQGTDLSELLPEFEFDQRVSW